MKAPNPHSHVTLRYRGHVTNKIRYISTFTRPMYPKLSRVVTQDERTPPTKSRDSSISRSRDKIKNVISPHLLRRVVTQDERTPPTKSRDSSISRSRGKKKNVIYPLLLSRVVTQDERNPPTKSRDSSISRSRDKKNVISPNLGGW